ncbi:alpha-1,4-galacturonosyltransferase [Corchorus olitorius]|uniref:Alpha-1,4-galacturonosyltransferase n=1 Tax=Corchorus olitorius TaxID=93759 RepID=A0A1R3GNF5_9ROSI|nr:alpha-1,4-galacturonosyltransferase [Corchorus olitorius]
MGAIAGNSSHRAGGAFSLTGIPASFTVNLNKSVGLLVGALLTFDGHLPLIPSSWLFIGLCLFDALFLFQQI